MSVATAAEPSRLPPPLRPRLPETSPVGQERSSDWPTSPTPRSRYCAGFQRTANRDSPDPPPASQQNLLLLGCSALFVRCLLANNFRLGTCASAWHRHFFFNVRHHTLHDDHFGWRGEHRPFRQR